MGTVYSFLFVSLPVWYGGDVPFCSTTFSVTFHVSKILHKHWCGLLVTCDACSLAYSDVDDCSCGVVTSPVCVYYVADVKQAMLRAEHAARGSRMQQIAGTHLLIDLL